MAKLPGNSEGKKLRLTVFLIKDGYENIVDFLEAGTLVQVNVETQGVSGVLFVRSGAPTTPSWVSIFNDVPGFKPHLLVNRSSRAVYVTKEPMVLLHIRLYAPSTERGRRRTQLRIDRLIESR